MRLSRGPLRCSAASHFLTPPPSLPSVGVFVCLGEPICPIVGSKEALCRTNEIKAHLGEGIKQTDRFNGPVQREGVRPGGAMNGRIIKMVFRYFHDEKLRSQLFSDSAE